MPHFIFGGDETGLQASNGDVKIIGDKGKKKHEVQTANSRISVTMYRIGNTAGSDGPTAFLPPGAHRLASRLTPGLARTYAHAPLSLPRPAYVPCPLPPCSVSGFLVCREAHQDWLHGQVSVRERCGRGLDRLHDG